MKHWSRAARAHCLRRIREQRTRRIAARDVVILIAGVPFEQALMFDLRGELLRKVRRIYEMPTLTGTLGLE